MSQPPGLWISFNMALNYTQMSKNCVCFSAVLLTKYNAFLEKMKGLCLKQAVSDELTHS